MTDPLLLLLFDLDGFKAYNDTFGHPAGRRSAHADRHSPPYAAWTERGTAYRMGGDEFCVLGRLGVRRARGARRIGRRGAVASCGEGFQVTASYGSVTLPIEARTLAEALRKAVQRMYARKKRRRASAGRQSADVLLQGRCRSAARTSGSTWPR